MPFSSASRLSMRSASAMLCVATSAASPVVAHDVEQRCEHRVRRIVIEVAGGLVREQHGRRVGDGTRDGDALLLAAREAGRPMALARVQPETGQQLPRPLPRRPLGASRDHLRQDHVLQRRELGQQMVELIDKTQTLAPQPGPSAIRQTLATLARDGNLRRRAGAPAARRSGAASTCLPPTGRPAPPSPQAKPRATPPSAPRSRCPPGRRSAPHREAPGRARYS